MKEDHLALFEQLQGLSNEERAVLFHVAVAERADFIEDTDPAEIKILEVKAPVMGGFSKVFRVLVEVGSGATAQRHEFVVKTGKDRSDLAAVQAEYATHLWETAQKQLPGVVTSSGVFEITVEKALITLVNREQLAEIGGKSFIFELQRAMPEQATQLLGLLRGLGLSTIQDENVVVGETAKEKPMTPERVQHVYTQIMGLLAEIHNDKQDIQRFLPSNETARETYQHSIMDVVTNPSRFDGLAAYVKETQLLPDSLVLLFRQKMMELAVLLSNKFEHRLSKVHGDGWASNYFLDEKDQVICIDPGTIPLSDPALDVVFTLADLVFVDVNKNGSQHKPDVFEGQYVNMASSLTSCYEQLAKDSDLRSAMALFYGFKSFVSAVFDAGTNSHQRMELIFSGLGALDSALVELRKGQKSEASFDFKKLQQYADHGRVVVNNPEELRISSL